MEKITLESLKFVKGEVMNGRPADIYFYDDVDYWDVSQFVREFQFLVDYVEVSKIRVHIHSVGGSCHEGIKAFSTILNSSVPVETYNDGLAASMASVIWAAGSERFMRDYAILMIHNPWIADNTDNPNDKIIIESFKKQLQIIYQSRFHMSEEEVKKIMDGEEGVDGTWMFAQDVIDAGIIDEAHIIKSSDDTVNAIAASVKGVKDLTKVSGIISPYLKKNNQMEVSATITEKVDNHLNNSIMTENEIRMIAAQLGLQGDATGAEITSKVNALTEAGKKHNDALAEIKSLKDSIAAKDTEIAGAKASIENLTKNLNDTKAKLKAYEDAEKAAKTAEINAMVEQAIKQGKIKAEMKDTWVKLAENDIELAKNTLAGIPAIENIAENIANTPGNAQAAQAGMNAEQQKAEEQVLAIVGKDFQFRTPKTNF